jgi:DNA-binding response OmpR family regulator
MKLLLILGSDEILNLIAQNIEPLGFDLIRYQHVLKAMDNIEEIAPSTIIISARDFPRHWKTLVQFVRYNHSKVECPIIILKGPNFSLEEASKAFFLGVSGIVSEDLTRPSEVDQLQRLLSRYIQLEEKRSANRFHIEDSKQVGICAVNPVRRSLITGPVKTISTSGISLQPEDALSLDALKENMELSECSLRIGEDFITPICRVVRTKPDMSMEFIFLPDVDRILLDNYLEALPLQELKAKQET